MAAKTKKKERDQRERERVCSHFSDLYFIINQNTVLPHASANFTTRRSCEPTIGPVKRDYAHAPKIGKEDLKK